MSRFFVEPPVGECCPITGEDARHIAKALRMRPGQEVTLCDGAGFDYRGALDSVEADHVQVTVLEKMPSVAEPAVHIRLYQALPKGEKLDFIVQKAVELGVAEIVPVLTERCISRPDDKSMAKKLVRLQKVARSAAEQSGRGIIPKILPLQSYKEAIAGMKTANLAILLYERETRPLSALLSDAPGRLALLVGSEGGISPEEASLARAEGIAAASLGARILRCETAPLCALSAILYACGEF